MAVVSSVLLFTSLMTPVMAATPKPVKMTCDEFVAVDDVVKPKLVYWAEGFNSKGKPVDQVVDVERTDRLIPVLITECKETPKTPFWERVKNHF
jgi:hypothetical protein